MRLSRSGLTSVQCSMRWRAFGRGCSAQRQLVRLQHHVDGHVAVGVDADLEAVPVRVLDDLVDLLLRHDEDAVVVGRRRRACSCAWCARTPSRRRALDAADAEPVVAEAGVDARRRRRSYGSPRESSGRRDAAARRPRHASSYARIVLRGARVVHRREPRRREELATCAASRVGPLALLVRRVALRFPTRSKTSRASSATRPLCSPSASRKKRPCSGSGVSRVMPASRTPRCCTSSCGRRDGSPRSGARGDGVEVGGW